MDRHIMPICIHWQLANRISFLRDFQLFTPFLEGFKHLQMVSKRFRKFKCCQWPETFFEALQFGFDVTPRGPTFSPWRFGTRFAWGRIAHSARIFCSMSLLALRFASDAIPKGPFFSPWCFEIWLAWDKIAKSRLIFCNSTSNCVVIMQFRATRNSICV